MDVEASHDDGARADRQRRNATSTRVPRAACGRRDGDDFLAGSEAAAHGDGRELGEHEGKQQSPGRARCDGSCPAEEAGRENSRERRRTEHVDTIGCKPLPV
jgi:hypothetical protein